jgi:hypothetical protein
MEESHRSPFFFYVKKHADQLYPDIVEITKKIFHMREEDIKITKIVTGKHWEKPH